MLMMFAGSYESSVAFGMRKALQAEQGKSDMENRIVQLEGEKKVREGGEREEREKKDRQEAERWERIERIEHELQSLRQATIAMQAQQAPASGVQTASNIDVPDQSSKSAARSATTSPRTDVDRLPIAMSSPISPV